MGEVWAIELDCRETKEKISDYFGLEKRIEKVILNKNFYPYSYYSLHSFTSGMIIDRDEPATHLALSPEQHAIILADIEISMNKRIKRDMERLKHFNRYLLTIDEEALRSQIQRDCEYLTDIEQEAIDEINEIEEYIRLKYNAGQSFYENVTKVQNTENVRLIHENHKKEESLLDRLKGLIK